MIRNPLASSRWIAFGFLACMSFTVYAQTAINLEVEQRLIEEFGQEKTEINDGAVLIVDGKYVLEPYIVERRGLNLYQNEIPHNTPWECWPIPEPELVEIDPGEPPNGGNPIDFYETKEIYEPAHAFWDAKEMYYVQHYSKEEAAQRLAADLEKASQREDADWKVRSTPGGMKDGFIEIISPAGMAIGWSLCDWPPPPKPTNEELLANVRVGYKSNVDNLRRKSMFIIGTSKGSALQASYNEGLMIVLDLMMSSLSYEQRLEKARQFNFKQWEAYQRLLTETLEPTPELVNKIESNRRGLLRDRPALQEKLQKFEQLMK